ncbi:MAG TPA: hypothetical protein DCM87_05250 [Planctomycetes bacterium]|nr:hypothetical protein [Planctomycetota bacterium]
MRFRTILLAFSALLGGCTTPRPEAAPQCAPAPFDRQEPQRAAAREEQPVRAAYADPDFALFARAFVPALSDGNVDPYVLSDADIDACFAPNIAPVIKSNRRGWVHGLRTVLEGKLLLYKNVAHGPEYSLTREGLSEGAARVKDLRIEITVNGNPHTIVIGAMYGAGAAWKILKAEVFE